MPPPAAASASRSAFLATVIGLCLLLAWDASGYDLWLAARSATAAGFALRNNALLVGVMHEAARFASWAGLVALFIAIRWPVGMLRRLTVGARAWLAMAVLANVIAVSLVKHSSHTSCPWDLAAFGGVARHVSHWHWGVPDGGPGGCFPAGHASAGFAYVAGWFAFRQVAPRFAAAWLAAALVAGLALGIAQQLRGAHYLSHTLWTAWICWSLSWALHAAARRLRGLHAAPRSGWWKPAPKLNRS